MVGGWKTQTNPLSYGGALNKIPFFVMLRPDLTRFIELELALQFLGTSYYKK